MFSTVPGFERPKASLRFEKDWYVSRNVASSGFPVHDVGISIALTFSSAIVDRGGRNSLRQALNTISLHARRRVNFNVSMQREDVEPRVAARGWVNSV